MSNRSHPETSDPDAALGSATASEGRTLRGRAVRASAIEFGAYAGGQGLRLASNLILTRLLFPEAFGLMAIVNIFNHGLIMLSDVGIAQSIVQNDRGEEPAFLNTAWTMQVIRGFALWILACALAWPAATLYEQPELLLLIPAGSFNVLVQGFDSTALHTLRRRLQLGRLALVELGAQLGGLMVVVPVAYATRSVWALVAGGLANVVVRLIASHKLEVGYRNRFQWDDSARHAIVHFGKWIFGSSALTFASRQGDRLILGRLLGMATLGVYSIALFLSEAISAVVLRITYGVFYPVFSSVRREGQQELKHLYYRTRLYMDGLAQTALGGLTALGPWVIELLYDPRYADAGWILRALAARVAVYSLLAPCETCLVALGKTQFGFYQNLGRSIWVLGGIPLGFHLWGLEGVVTAVVTAELPALVVLYWGFARARMLNVLMELRAPAFYASGLALGYAALWVLPDLSP